MTIFLNNWANASAETIRQAFDLEPHLLHNLSMLLASYTAKSDSGYAFILFEESGQLYEVNASHDSEMNFQGQWEPEETSVDALQFRLQRGKLGLSDNGTNLFRQELLEVLEHYRLH